MDKVRVAIVGCGTISQLNGPGYLMYERCEVVALCDPVRERAEVRARQWGITPRIYTSYDDVLNDSQIDAVELLTPTRLHAEQIVAAQEAGKHVSCQKPMSNTLDEADEIMSAVVRAKTRFRVTENFMFYPPIVKARELLDKEVIGEPSLIRIRSLKAVRTLGEGLTIESGAMAWRHDPEANAGGFMFDAAWHAYATAMWWLGDAEVEKVCAIVSKTDDFVVELPSAIIWKFKAKNCLAVFDAVFAEHFPVRSKYYPLDDFFEIQGSKGSIWVTRCSGEMLDLAPVIVHKGTETTGINVPTDWVEGFNGAARNFIDSIIDGGQPDLDVHFSRKVLQVVLAAYRAAETERAVDPSTVT